ncbi:MAG: MFS transporter [Planctomycetia bacterium]|nr:MFS transporter [Planctomycetia bacterium]
MTTEPIAAASAPTRIRYAVLFWICLASAIAYTQRNTLGVVEKDMRQELELTTGDSAKIMSTSFFFTYALCQVPSGWLGKVWGSRRALAVFSAVCSVATALCAVATRVPVFAGLRAVMGINQAGLFPCTTATVKNWFSGLQWGMANGFITASQSLGAAGGMAVAGYVAVLLGWRWTFAVFAIPGLIWAAWFSIWFRNRPEEHRSVNAGELALMRVSAPGYEESSAPEHEGPVPWKALLLSPALCWFCTQQFFRGAGYIFFSTWFTTYLRDVFGVEKGTAGVLTSLPLCANGIGCIVGGAFSDWLLVRTGSRRISRQGLAVVCQLGCAALALFASRIADVHLFVLVMSLGALCAASGGPIAYAVSIDMGRSHARPVFSLMNTWGNLGSMSFPFLISLLVGESPKAADWAPVVPVFAGVYAFAGLAWLGFNPDKPILPERAPNPAAS